MFNVLMLAAAMSSGPAQNTNKLTGVAEALIQVTAARVEGAISVDGKLDEAAWQETTPHTTFTQRDPNEGQRATEETGINFRRMIMRTNEQAYAALRPKKESGFVSRFLPLVGLSGLQPKRRFLVTPYTTAKTRTSAAEPGNPFNDGRRNNAAFGTDSKLGLGSNLTLDATINPDFGQVEVDPAVVNLSDVESFFDEKRPFFIEGSDTFGFGWGGASNNMSFNFSNPSLFYSRRIGRTPQGSIGAADFSRSPGGVRIDAAAKITGKVSGAWNLGLLHALTGRAQADLSIDGRFSKAVVEPRASYSVLRAQRDFAGGHQGLGFIGTLVSRDLTATGLENQLNRRAASFGVDGWTTLGHGKGNERIWALTGRFAVSGIAGAASRITAVQRASQHYFQRPDATHLEVDPNATSLSGYGVNSDNRKSLTLRAGTRGGYGKQGSNYGRGARVSVDWKPAPKLSLSVSPDYQYQKNGAQFVANLKDAAAAATFGTRHVFARLQQKTLSAGIRINWTFTPALSLQTYIQPLISSGRYTDFGDLARPRSYEFVRYATGALPPGVGNPDFTFKSIRGNAVLRWEFRPGSSAYFVWTQRREDSDPTGEFRLGRSFSNLLDAKADNIFLVKFAFGWAS